MRRKTVGIIGGVGPEATVAFFRCVVRATPAREDQDHLRILIDNHPQVPGRVAAIVGDGPSPAPALLESARLLERAGADFLVVPCNTAHYFLPYVRNRVSIPVLDMVAEVVAWLQHQGPPVRRAGLLASTAALQVELYQKPMRVVGIEPLLPPEPEQERLMRAIFRLKAGAPPEQLRSDVMAAVDALVDRGADAVVAGCSELPVIINAADVPVIYADGNAILARAVVDYALAGA